MNLCSNINLSVDNVYINPLKTVNKNIENCSFQDDTIIVDEKWIGYAPGNSCRFIQNSIGNRIPSFNLLESKIYKDNRKLKNDCKYIYVIESVLNILKGK